MTKYEAPMSSTDAEPGHDDEESTSVPNLSRVPLSMAGDVGRDVLARILPDSPVVERVPAALFNSTI